MENDKSAVALPGYTKRISQNDNVFYEGSKLIKYRNKIRGEVEDKFDEIINATEGSFDIRRNGLVYARGNPISGFTINPDNNDVVTSDIRNSAPPGKPSLLDLLKQQEPRLRSLTKDYVNQNGNLLNTEQSRILNSPYYQGVATSTPGTSVEGPVTSGQELSNLEIKASKPSQNFKIMRYPLESGGTNLDYIKFGIFESVSSKFGGYPDKDGKIQGRIAQFTNKEYAAPIGTIYLPIQPNINDANTVDWGEDTMGLLQMAAANISLSITGGGAATTENIADQISLEGAANRDDIIKAVRASVAETLAKSGSNVFTRVTGAMLNPNLELLFKGPKLRQFDYTIKLTPRSVKEGNMVRKIIRAFKQNMAPRLAANNYFLQTPNVFSIDYVINSGEKNIKGLNKIKKSALMSCSVNYTPANNYMPYVDGTMTSYELTLRFQELLPIYDSDYLSEFADAELNTNESASENITIGY